MVVPIFYLLLYGSFIHLNKFIMYQIIYNYRQKRASVALTAESFTNARESFKATRKAPVEIIAVRRVDLNKPVRSTFLNVL